MKNIFDTLATDPTYTTLITAIKAADLVDTLSGQGPFTVFAPSNQALAKIPEVTLKAILDDKPKLTGILTYHVVSGKILSKDISTMPDIMTMQGKKLAIDVKQGVKVNDATVTQADIECSNGVIHAIDTVLMP